MYEYQDGCSIKFVSSVKLIVEFKNELFEFDESDKPNFDNGLGESVIEYTGLCVDNNPIQSWGKATYTPEAYSKLHYHQERTEDYYIIDGQAKVMLDGEEYHLSRGDHIRILPGQLHQVFNESAQEELKLIVKCVPAWIKEDFHLAQTFRKTFS